MRLANIIIENQEKAAIVKGKNVIPVKLVNEKFGKNYPEELFGIIQTGELEEMNNWYCREGKKQLSELAGESIDKEKAEFAPLYRNPRKIWGIGLNYVEHASDLSEKAPSSEPASFMKPDTTIIGPGDSIKIPVQSQKTTAEAELGVVIGEKCKDIEEAEVHRYIAGYTTILDMTAEDILWENPRYLTRSKSFDTFFSFGPVLVTPDEVQDLEKIRVATKINGKVHRENIIANMTFSPHFLVSFHSKVMTMLPGDIISTGTPGAATIKDGDVVECIIEGFEGLKNPVIDLKNQKN